MATDRYAPSMASGVPANLPPAARTPQTDAHWLELRVQADNAARAVTARTLLPRLVHYLAATGAGNTGVEVIDLGSGTGANQRWLAPRLPFRQRWLLIDQEQALQHHHPVAPRTRLLTADVGILTSVLDQLGSAQLVTCSALLDLLTLDQLEAISSALAAARQPALFSLTVTGAMELSPPHPLDSHLIRAFNDHQRRGGRAGPDAVQILTGRYEPPAACSGRQRRHGYSIGTTTASSSAGSSLIESPQPSHRTLSLRLGRRRLACTTTRSAGRAHPRDQRRASRPAGPSPLVVASWSPAGPLRCEIHGQRARRCFGSSTNGHVNYYP